MFLRIRRTPPGFIQPCLPYPAERPPEGPGWIHEIKLDGLRLMARSRIERAASAKFDRGEIEPDGRTLLVRVVDLL